MRLSQLESELKKRFAYPYEWGRVQNNSWDRQTNFIFEIPRLDELLITCEEQLSNQADYKQKQSYALNRWYNFWSAWAVERVFGSATTVAAADNPKDAEKDFFIKDIPFDHKTTIFPKNYPHTFDYAQLNPESLVQWLYTNQSKGKRQHYKNRLFIVLYDSYFQQHWQLKAHLVWLKALVDYYVNHFDLHNLMSIEIEGHPPVLTDIIWAIR